MDPFLIPPPSRVALGSQMPATVHLRARSEHSTMSSLSLPNNIQAFTAIDWPPMKN